MAVSYPAMKDLIPTDEEWVHVRSLVVFLAEIKHLSVKMESESNVTASAVIPDYNNAIDHCEEFLANDKFQFMEGAIELCCDKLKRYYAKTNIIAMAATYFDPRYRMQYFVNEGFPKHELTQLAKFVRDNYESKRGGSKSNQDVSDTTMAPNKSILESKLLFIDRLC